MWSLTRWVTTLAVSVGVVTVAVVGTQLIRDKSWLEAGKSSAPIVAALIALLSLIATSVSLTANWRRLRRHETLKAWNEWSDKAYASRRNVTKHLGMEAIPERVGRALADDKPLVEDNIDISDTELRHSVARDLVTILNGLERISVGTQVGVYDITTLRRVGGTIIVREWERGEMYVIARRTASDVKRRQAKAFVALETLANDLERHRLREEQGDLDRKRLSNLRRTR